MGLSSDVSDEGSKDLGVQYRMTVSDTGDFEIFSTADFDASAKLGKGKR